MLTSSHKHFVVVSRYQQAPPLLPAISVTTCHDPAAPYW